MGLFDFLRKKNESKIELKTEVAPGIVLSPALSAHWPEIEKSKLDYIKIEASPNASLGLTKSKFFGSFYLPSEVSYPQDIEGNTMFPLAQINFSEAPALHGYPEKGILQFYISNNDIYGINFEDLTNQDSFRVLYFEDVNEEDMQTDFAFLKDGSFDSAPISEQMELKFSRGIDYAGISDVRFRKNFGKPFCDWTTQFGTKEDEVMDEMGDVFGNWSHKIGGYAEFTQDDPRDEEQEDWVVLLQINSQDDVIMWGDCGVCNFFIHPDDLKKKDFSRVLYTWDCS